MTWYVACLSKDVRGRPVARTVDGTPLALFRDGDGGAVALLDRCPHRNVPLSFGTVEQGQLQCCYHGWRFDSRGACRAIPGLTGETDKRARRATAFPTAEHDGFVWVQTAAHTAPADGAGLDAAAGLRGVNAAAGLRGLNAEAGLRGLNAEAGLRGLNAEAGLRGLNAVDGPYRFPHVATPGYTTVRKHVRFHAGLHACLENTLDVPHTAFLHGGLFRGNREPVEIEVVVRPIAGGVEAEYLGEPRPEGLAGRILAPEGGVVTHFDRFLLPSIAQVEYRLGENHLVNTAVFTPVSEFETDLHAAITLHLRLPHAPVRAAITPIVNRILRQDAEVLRRQSEAVQRFGGEQFASTELDVLGQHIRKLLRQAERGEAPAVEGADADERRITMRV